MYFVLWQCRSNLRTISVGSLTPKTDKYAKFVLQEKQQIVQELNGRLQSQQNMFTKATAKNDVFTLLHCSYNWPFEG